MAKEDDFDLINLDGPLTVEAILKTLQQRFMDGHYYVSLSVSGWARSLASRAAITAFPFECVSGYGHGEGGGRGSRVTAAIWRY